MDSFIPKPSPIETIRTLRGLFSRRQEPGLGAHPGSSIDPPDDAEVVDFERMVSEFGGHAEVAKKALRRFVGAGEDCYLKPVASAVSAGDTARLHDAAHKIKGAAGCIRASRLVRAADEVMRAAKAGDRDVIRSEMDTLSGEMAMCLQVIRRLLDQDVAEPVSWRETP